MYCYCRTSSLPTNPEVGEGAAAAAAAPPSVTINAQNKKSTEQPKPSKVKPLARERCSFMYN